MERLQKNMGYAFSDPSLLEQALTHRSLKTPHNERLEFLGDAVLGLIIAHVLFDLHPMRSEGELSLHRSQLVNRDSLLEVARTLGLPDCMQVGSGERRGGRIRPSILADALEALIGAVFLDGGLIHAQDCVKRWFAPLLDKPYESSYKCQLQQWTQSKGYRLPMYALVRSEGVAHHQQFFVTCELIDLALIGEGVGTTKRAAEQAAAQSILEQISAMESSS